MPDLRDELQSKLGTSYTLERELGGGGMSRVFVAAETALGRRVVVKVLPPELAQGVSVDRFKREIQLAAQLQHPHIVPVLTAGDVDGLPYYVMPFVEGESLRARLARGELPVPDVVAILRDVVKALDSAHTRGVVHRDIKPDNVLLSGGSAMVTDFGVAKAIASAASVGDRADTLTMHGIALGTPMYMAPEQAAADPRTDHRADIYALGTTAYEMLAGRPPFAGRLQQQLAAAHATEAPVSVTQVRPAVPPALGALVMRCLEKHPADRPQSAREILQALDAITTPAGGSMATGVSPWKRRRIAIVAAVAAVAVVAVSISVYRMASRHPLNPKRVLVVPLENLTGDPSLAQVGRIASDWITQGVAEMDSIQVVSSLTLLSEAAGNAIGAANVRRLAERLRAGTAVSGAFYKQGDSLRFQAQVTQVGTGNVLQSVDGVIGSASDPMVAIRLLRERLMGALATSSDARGMALGGAPRYEAYREFIRGQELFNQQDFDHAIPLFRGAIAVDSTFTAAYVMLATSNANAGRWAVADSILRIVEARRDVSRGDRPIVDFSRAMIDGDRDAAFRVVRAAAARDSTFVWLYLVGYNGINRNYPHAAVAALEAVSNPDSTWVPYWVVLAVAYHQLGDFKNELRVANHADAIHPTRLFAQRLSATAASGDVAAVRRLIDSVVVASTDTVNTPAAVMYNAFLELRTHGHPKDAAELLARARSWLAERPPTEELTRRGQRRMTANVLFSMGRFDSAYARYIDLARDTTDIEARGRVGTSAAGLHDTVTARRISEELARAKFPYAHGTDTYWRAAISASLGDKELAVRLLNQAIKEGFGISTVIHRQDEFQSLRGYEPFEAILRPKG